MKVVLENNYFSFDCDFILQTKGHDGPGVAHLSLLTKHIQFPTSCDIYVLPNNKILNSSV